MITNIISAKTRVIHKISWGCQQEDMPKQLIILCHGFQANGTQMLQIGESWTDSVPQAAFSAPHAPYFCKRRIGKFLPFSFKSDDRMWYKIRDYQIANQETGVRAATRLLDAFIDFELARLSLQQDAYALAGFSQGAVLVLHAGLRRRVAPKAIIAMSGGLVNPSSLQTEIQNRAPVMLLHGEEDSVVTISHSRNAEKTLLSLGVPVKAIYRPKLGHAVDEGGIISAGNFLRAAFEKPHF